MALVGFFHPLEDVTEMAYTETNGIRAYYEVSGNGRPLVLIHGVTLDHRMWEPQISHFRARYRVLAYDVRGHGRSDGSDRNYTIDLLADDLKALLDHLHIERPIVCGLSMGGMIAQIFAARYPDDLSALVIADSAESMALTLQERSMRLLLPRFLVRRLIITFRRQYADLFLWFFRGMDPEVKDLFRRSMIEFKREEFLKLMDCFHDFDSTDQLSNITVPTLIIVGENELMGLPHAKRMAELIEDSSIVEIAGAYHLSNLENPEGFNEAVDGFLSSIPGELMIVSTSMGDKESWV